MSPPIKVGIVGFGEVGKIRAAAVTGNPNLRLIGVADPNPGVEKITEELRVTPDYRELLSWDVDAVFVCTPNAVTAEVVVAALEASKHVFCEKPPGRSLEDVHLMAEAKSKRPAVKIKFGFNHRYHDAVQEALSISESGQLGNLLWLRGVYGKSGGVGFENIWRSKRETAGGGILLDQGIHMLDLFRLFCGDFDEVKSFVTNSYWKIDVEDNAFAVLRNKKNQVALLHSSSTQWKHTFSMEIAFSEGYVAIQGILSGTRSYGRETLIMARKQADRLGFPPENPHEEVSYFNEDLSWQREVDEFADSILEDRSIQHGSLEDAMRAMELVYQIYQSDQAWWKKVQSLDGKGKLVR